MDAALIRSDLGTAAEAAVNPAMKQAQAQASPAPNKEAPSPPLRPDAPRVRIYRPAYNPNQSGRRPSAWVLEFEPAATPNARPWPRACAPHPLAQVRLHFASLEQACRYARRHGYHADIVPPSVPRLRPRFPSLSFAIA